MGGQFDGVKIGDVHKQGSSPSPGKASERLREIETGDLREILPHTLYILRYGVERDEETDLESDKE